MTDDRIRESRKQERHGAKVYGGTVNAGSGNQSRKGDVRTPEENIEFKTTTAVSYSLKQADLKLAYKQALLIGRRALFGIQFTHGHDIDRYVIMKEDDYLQIKEFINRLNENYSDDEE